MGSRRRSSAGHLRVDLHLGICILNGLALPAPHDASLHKRRSISFTLPKVTPVDPWGGETKRETVTLERRFVSVDLACGYWLLSLYAAADASDEALIAAATCALLTQVNHTASETRDLRISLARASMSEVQVSPVGWAPSTPPEPVQ